MVIGNLLEIMLMTCLPQGFISIDPIVPHYMKTESLMNALVNYPQFSCVLGQWILIQVLFLNQRTVLRTSIFSCLQDWEWSCILGMTMPRAILCGF